MLDVSEFDKDQLAEYALTFDPPLALDMRKSIVKLREEVVKLKSKPVVADVVAPASKNATHLRNKLTGLVFPWTELLHKHLGENAIVCDENGNEV